MMALDRLKTQLHPGQVYRRKDLEPWSTAVDRHLKELLDEGVLKKMSPGVYYCPKLASFGEVPPKEEELVRAFLKSNDFLLTDYNFYNGLGVGTTQLYNHQVVYNHKRHGEFKLGGRNFDFRLKHKFPRKLSKEFLVVDLLNHLNELAEDNEAVLQMVKKKYFSPASTELQEVINEYAQEKTKTLFRSYSQRNLVHA